MMSCYAVDAAPNMTASRRVVECVALSAMFFLRGRARRAMRAVCFFCASEAPAYDAAATSEVRV